MLKGDELRWRELCEQFLLSGQLLRLKWVRFDQLLTSWHCQQQLVWGSGMFLLVWTGLLHAQCFCLLKQLLELYSFIFSPLKTALGAMAKSWKTTVGFVMYVCLSTRKNSPPTGRIFSKNFILNIVNKICRENSNLVTIRQKYHALYVKTYIRFTVISGSNIPEIKKKVPINFVAQITLHISRELYFSENRGVCERIYEQFGTARQVTVSEHNMAWQKFDLHAG